MLDILVLSFIFNSNTYCFQTIICCVLIIPNTHIMLKMQSLNMFAEKKRRRSSASSNSSLYSDNCVCLRPQTMVLCNGCGWFVRGRISQICGEHPYIKYMYDIENCPICFVPSAFMTQCPESPQK